MVLKKGEKNRTEKYWKLTTWNNKIYNLEVIGITETKKKWRGESIFEEGQRLIYSSVDEGKRTKAGVDCIITNTRINEVEKWQGYSE